MTKQTNILQVQLGTLTLDNPVIPASGTFGFGEAYEDLYDLNILGSIAFKGTTREPRNGNPTPRIAECSSGMLNAVGLENPGVEDVIKNYIPHLASRFHKPLVANISGFSLEKYIGRGPDVVPGAGRQVEADEGHDHASDNRRHEPVDPASPGQVHDDAHQEQGGPGRQRNISSR